MPVNVSISRWDDIIALLCLNLLYVEHMGTVWRAGRTYHVVVDDFLEAFTALFQALLQRKKDIINSFFN